MAKARYGPQALSLLKNGLDAKNALAAVLAGDDDRELRQVAIVDAHGNVAVFTGSKVLEASGSVQGRGFTCQANMMLRSGVPEAMASTFESATGGLERRILSALDAAQEAGGDVRGMQSASIQVRPPADSVPPGPFFNLPGTDFRVDHSDTPLKVLRSLLDNRDAEQQSRSQENTASLEQARLTHAAVEGLALTDELAFWHAVRTLSIKHQAHDEAIGILVPIIENNPNWAILMHRLPELPEDSPLRTRFQVRS
jgi:uncharacterized Ntn-hydrolase superfamily protein